MATFSENKTSQTAAQNKNRTPTEQENNLQNDEALLDLLPGMAYRLSLTPSREMQYASSGSLELTGYSPADLINGKTDYHNLILPEDKEKVQREIDSAVQQKQGYQMTYRIQTASGRIQWIEDRGRYIQTESSSPIIAGFVTNIHAQIERQQQLEQLYKESTQEFTTLTEVSQSIASTLELEPLLGLILSQLRTVVDYHGASIMVLDNEMLRIIAYNGPIPAHEATGLKFPLSSSPNKEVIEQKTGVVIPDILGNSEMARAFRESAGEKLGTIFGYIRSWMGVPLMVKNQVVGMLSLDHGIPYYYLPQQSKLVQAFANQAAIAVENARLYDGMRQRADETQTLLAVQKAITSRLDPSTVLQMIADEARRLTNTEQSAVYLLEGDELVVSVVSGSVDPKMLGYRLPVDGSVAGLAIQTGKAFLVTDAENDARVFSDIIRRIGARSFAIVPLMSDDGPLGTITVANKKSNDLGQDDEWVLSVLASGAVVAMENARLYREEQKQRRHAERRRQVAEQLRDILAILNSDHSLRDILDHIVSQAGMFLHTKGCILYRADLEKEEWVIESTWSMPEGFDQVLSIPLKKSQLNQAILNRQPVVIPDLLTQLNILYPDPENLTGNLKRWYDLISTHFKAYLSVPLLLREDVYGGISLYYDTPKEFSDEDIRLAISFSDQAALAIENARLRSQAERIAVTMERNRLARDLHDAVTQTLFSASLIAEVLPRLWERNPAEAERRLGELRELTRGALAEMRTLLMELRPSALAEAELREIFQHLTDAFVGRTRVPVELNIHGETTVPEDVKVALYRIAQEALNNAAKHAGASRVYVQVDCTPGQVKLFIVDNGSGFDPKSIPLEHLGLGIMKERAEKIGASFEIISQPGSGTKVSLVWTDYKTTGVIP